MHIYQLLPYVLSTSFSTHPKPLTWDKKPFQSRRVHFFRHYETFLLFSALWDWFFFRIFLLFLPSIFDILQQNGCSKNPKASPFYIFRHYATYRKLQKNSGKNFFSIFSFLRAFVVSSCRKSGFRFRVFLSLRYGADLGRSRLVSYFFRLSQKTMSTWVLEQLLSLFFLKGRCVLESSSTNYRRNFSLQWVHIYFNSFGHSCYYIILNLWPKRPSRRLFLDACKLGNFVEK